MIRPIQDNSKQDNNPTKPNFKTGQLVRHKRYGYRGVIVDFDPTCKADQQWYQSNQTQPEQNQPWYHVLVHNSDQVTYPAQSSLTEDTSNQPIEHPLLSHFFSEFMLDGKYLRNDRPWPH